MKIAVFGQAAFGKDVTVAVAEAGHEIVGVYSPPEGGRPDPLAEEAQARVLILRLPTPSGRPSFPQLARHLDTLDAVFVDLAPAARPEIFFQTDNHINVAGHLLVADSVEQLLRRLLDSRP